MAIRRINGVLSTGMTAFLLAGTLLPARPAAGQTYTVLYPFRASVRITSSLVEVGPGEFYGTTDSGGAWSRGSVVKVTTAGVATTLHSFDSNTDGENPVAGLVYDGAGDFLYGTTTSGGLNGRGTIFRIKPDGTSFETVYDFLVGTDPYLPRAALIMGSGGLLYGTTVVGGASGLGTVFSLDVSTTPATLTTLWSFSGGAADGARPAASLLESGGFLYGTTTEGGPDDIGTVFKLSTSGSMQWVTPFNGTNGRFPMGGVVEKGGVFYGTAEQGGFWGSGTVFEVTDAGVLTKIYDFGNGQNPYAGLTLGDDGLLYGTTREGERTSAGRSSGSIRPRRRSSTTTRHSFDGTDGAAPTTGLVMGSDGKAFRDHIRGGPGAATARRTGVNPTPPLTSRSSTPTREPRARARSRRSTGTAAAFSTARPPSAATAPAARSTGSIPARRPRAR